MPNTFIRVSSFPSLSKQKPPILKYASSIITPISNCAFETHPAPCWTYHLERISSISNSRCDCIDTVAGMANPVYARVARIFCHLIASSRRGTMAESHTPRSFSQTNRKTIEFLSVSLHSRPRTTPGRPPFRNDTRDNIYNAHDRICSAGWIKESKKKREREGKKWRENKTGEKKEEKKITVG